MTNLDQKIDNARKRISELELLIVEWQKQNGTYEVLQRTPRSGKDLDALDSYLNDNQVGNEQNRTWKNPLDSMPIATENPRPEEEIADWYS
tara:strand:- start:262 stop:534 length:273 start_codon:yes stop_codon:yes gene_type:complete